MGSSSSRHRPRPQQQQTPGGGGGMNNGQFYGGYAAQQPQAQFGGGAQQPPAPAGGARYGYGQPPRPAVAAQEYTQTATVKNQVNLKKWTLKVTPLPGRPHEFGLSFSFDATAPCRVTTYLLATEDPKDGCRLVSAVLGAPVRTPVVYEKGMNLQFPPEGDEEVAEAHVISSLRAPLGHMMLAAGDSYPLIIRLESMTDEGREQGHSLDELEVGGAFAPWSQAQTTYAKLKQDEAGAWQVAVLKQKIWVKGVSYQLQEIYGLEAATKKRPGGGEEDLGAGGLGGSYDELEGRECVVCMSEARDTMVLPCRHMCLCRECAGALKSQTSKCPICREEIESLLHIRIKRKSSSKSRS